MRSLWKRRRPAPILTMAAVSKARLTAIEPLEARDMPGSMLGLMAFPFFPDVVTPPARPVAFRALTPRVSIAAAEPVRVDPAPIWTPARPVVEPRERAEPLPTVRVAPVGVWDLLGGVQVDGGAAGARGPTADGAPRVESSAEPPAAVVPGAGVADFVPTHPGEVIEPAEVEPGFAGPSFQPPMALESGAAYTVHTDAEYIYAGEQVGFYVTDASGNVPYGVQVSWDFDYSSVFVPHASIYGPDVVTELSPDGERTVAARVEESDGSFEIATLGVTVRHPPPDLTVPADFSVPAGDTPRSLTVEAETDVAIESVDWWLSIDGDDYLPEPEMEGLDASYTFKNYGEYDFWLVVTDENGEVAEDGFRVTATNDVPEATAYYTGPDGQQGETVDEGKPVTFTVTQLDRELDLDTTDSLTVEADWYGAGKWEVVNDAEWTVDWAAKSVELPFTYDDNNVDGAPWQPRIRVSDDWGHFTEDTVNVHVRNVAPTGVLDAGFHMATMQSSGQEVWAIFPDTMLRLKPPAESAPGGPGPASGAGPAGGGSGPVADGLRGLDPSAADVASLQFHWKIDGVDWSVADAKYNTSTISLKSKLAAEHDSAGTVHDVEVYVEDKDGGESERYVFKAAVFPPVYPMASPQLAVGDGPAPAEEFTATGTQNFTAPGLGYGPAANQVYGEFHPDAGQGGEPMGGAAGTYLRFSEWPAVILEDNTGGFNASFAFDQPSKDFAAANKATPYYRFVVERRLAPGVPPRDIADRYRYEGNTTGTIDIGTHGNDLQVLVTVIPELRKDGAVFRTAGPHQIVIFTPRSPNTGTLDDILDLWKLVRDLGPRFGQAAGALFQSMSEGGFSTLLDNLKTGVAEAGRRFVDDFQEVGKREFFNWLGAGQLPPLANYDFGKWDDIQAFLLQYAGLTWDHVQAVLVQELGAGNVAAVQAVYDQFLAHNPDVNNPRTMVDFVRTKLNSPEMAGIVDEMVAKAKQKIVEEVARAVPMLFAQFVPGAGTIRALYNGLNWLLDNREQLGEVFTKVVDSMNALAAGNVPDFQNQLYDAMKSSVGVVIPLLARQFGLDRLPRELKRVAEFVPNKVDAFLRKEVKRIAATAKGGGAPVAKEDIGALTPQDSAVGKFAYKGKNYKVLPVEAGASRLTVTQIKITHLSEGNKVHVFEADDFVQGAARDAFSDLAAKAAALRSQANGPTRAVIHRRNAPPAQQTRVQDLAALQQQVVQAVDHLVKEVILKDACLYLSGGCFAAGTLLWTPSGYRAVEAVRPGEVVYARGEGDPRGPVEAKVVEETFERFSGVWEVELAGGRVVRTTAEHPFFERGRGWVAACELRPGDALSACDGSWVRVERVTDTGVWEQVYNVRVADHHTYFVGSPDWGLSVWAHNAYSGQHFPRGAAIGATVWEQDRWFVAKGPERRTKADRVVQYADGSKPFVFETRDSAIAATRHQVNYEAEALDPNTTDAGVQYEQRVRKLYPGQVTRVAEVIMGVDEAIKGEIDFQTGSRLFEVGTSFDGKRNQLIRLCIVARLRGQGQKVMGIHQIDDPGRFQGLTNEINALRFNSPAVIALLTPLVPNPAAYTDDTPLSAYFDGFRRVP